MYIKTLCILNSYNFVSYTSVNLGKIQIKYLPKKFSF